MTTKHQRIPRNGKTIQEIAEKTSFSTNTIIRWTSEPRAVYLTHASKKRDRVRELRNQGLTIRVIAKETGYSVGTVHRYVKEMNKQVSV